MLVSRWVWSGGGCGGEVPPRGPGVRAFLMIVLWLYLNGIQLCNADVNVVPHLSVAGSSIDRELKPNRLQR